jgi:hypothetical protein
MQRKKYGARFGAINLSDYWNWPGNKQLNRGKPSVIAIKRNQNVDFWKKLEELVVDYPSGQQSSWGIPFQMSEGTSKRVILIQRGEMEIRLRSSAEYLCLLHTWRQLPEETREEAPCEGLVVGEHEIRYADGTNHVQPIRARFEVEMAESPGPPWLAISFEMPTAVDPAVPNSERYWGDLQTATIRVSRPAPLTPLLYALPNPHPEREIESLVIRNTMQSPLLVAGLTLYRGASHPLRHLPRRSYLIEPPGEAIEEVEVDLGTVNRIEKSDGARDMEWLRSDHIGTSASETEHPELELIEATGAEDATLSVKVEGKTEPYRFSLGEAFHEGKSDSGEGTLRILGRDRQWITVKVIDSSTGKPTPTRIHFSGSHGEYLAPYGHHSQINVNWFEDYGADVVVGGRNFAYVPGEFVTDMPVGDLYVEVYKGFEYTPVRRKMTLQPGQKTLEIAIDRWKDLRKDGWVTADTHVHFISPQTAALEAQAEGINMVHLLATQLGRVFTNVGDITGKPNVVEKETIVFVGTENRHHMLGHISMLGTRGLPVYPMCAGGTNEAWIGDPDYRAMAEWARENREKGGLVIRPHFPMCGHTEDPVPILKGLVDALEIWGLKGSDFPTQEWYRYLNCGYRVAVVGGTDKMGAYKALGWLRTYAKLDMNKPFTYESWAEAVRAGRTISTSGPLIDLKVEGEQMGDCLELPSGGGTLGVEVVAESFWPLGKLELVINGRVVADSKSSPGSKRLSLSDKVSVDRSGWIAARCSGLDGHPGGYMAAHTSPVYVKCGRSRAFDGPAAEHMLALVEGGIEYLNTMATVEAEAQERMVKLFFEAREELERRLREEGPYSRHAPTGAYHTHGHGRGAGHSH